MYAGFGAAGRDYIFNGPGLGQLEAYLAIIVLACLGYGAVFLLLSMMFRIPRRPRCWCWAGRAINPVLPSLLQKISVASYLRHLMPVTVAAERHLCAAHVETEPVSGWAARRGCLLLIAVVLSTPAIAFARSRSATQPNSNASQFLRVTFERQLYECRFVAMPFRSLGRSYRSL
jgi:hypothetical protein